MSPGRGCFFVQAFSQCSEKQADCCWDFVFLCPDCTWGTDRRCSLSSLPDAEQDRSRRDHRYSHDFESSDEADRKADDETYDESEFDSEEIDEVECENEEFDEYEYECDDEELISGLDLMKTRVLLSVHENWKRAKFWRYTNSL